ncbi:MAG: hypothetical protein KBS35_00615 [Mycoplasma sp.]|nr:hypothetical protein [Candidatus Hennigella equi]
MATKYCPNCKKVVETHMSAGQVIMLLILLGCGILPGILYGMGHAKKCPSCGTRCISKRNAN